VPWRAVHRPQPAGGAERIVRCDQENPGLPCVGGQRTVGSTGSRRGPVR